MKKRSDEARLRGQRPAGALLAAPAVLLLLLATLLYPSCALGDATPDQQIRSTYVRLDAAYCRRDAPSVTAFLATDFKRVKWDSVLTPAQFQTDLADSFDQLTSVSASSRLVLLITHSDRADAVVVRRIGITLPKSIAFLLPPYFSVSVTQEQWRKTQGQWCMTQMVDTPLVQTLDLLNERDQGIRRRFLADRKNPALAAQMPQVDAADQVRLKQIIRQCGWPGFDLAGTGGESAAFEIVQHSDDDPAFQKRCLPLIVAAIKHGQAVPSDAAYLTDRIRAGEHKPQVYGTQGNIPIEDPAHVDQRRASVGLASLATYQAQLKTMYQPKP